MVTRHAAWTVASRVDRSVVAGAVLELVLGRGVRSDLRLGVRRRASDCVWCRTPCVATCRRGVGVGRRRSLHARPGPALLFSSELLPLCVTSSDCADYCVVFAHAVRVTTVRARGAWGGS